MQTESGLVRSQEHTISTLPAEAAGNKAQARHISPLGYLSCWLRLLRLSSIIPKS